MARRTRTYVCFDADNDMAYYRTMQMWKANDNIDFDFNNAHDLNQIMPWSNEETIKRDLRERMKNSKILVVLIGDKTRFQNTYVRWEIDLALEAGIPVICVNLDGGRDYNEELCPKILRDQLAIHINFGAAIMQIALDTWPDMHKDLIAKGKTGPKQYSSEVYFNIDHK